VYGSGVYLRACLVQQAYQNVHVSCDKSVNGSARILFFLIFLCNGSYVDGSERKNRNEEKCVTVRKEMAM